MTADAMTLEQAASEVVSAYLDQHDPRYLAEDIVVDVVAAGRVRVGRAAAAALVHDVRHRLFRQVEETVTATHVAGDVVVVELVLSGMPAQATHSGATRPVTVRAAAVATVAGGEIRSIRIYFDRGA